MIYIETGSDNVYHNFGLELYFAAEKKLDEPVLLFWRTTPTLMVGKYQNTLEEINQSYAEQHGIQVVRRLSGGGTIYTDPGGWQFTFIDYNEDAQITFTQYIAPVVDALRALGVPAEFNGRNDLVIGGRKFSGNAQYKQGGTTVHHGSLLFSTDIAQMVASTTVDPYKILSKSIRSVRDRVTNISEHLPQPMDTDAFKQHMVRYLMRGSERVYTPTEQDLVRVRQLAAERFDNWQCKYGANPKFEIVKTGRFAGGKMEFRLTVKRGVIQDAAVSGDYFAAERADRLAQCVIGCAYEKTAVLSALQKAGMDGAVYGVSAAEIAMLITE